MDTSSGTKRTSGSRRVKAPGAPRVWQVLERSAYNSDGSLWFPTRLTEQWLEDQKATLGPYLFSSQYLNKPVADEDRKFMPEWIVYKECFVEYSEGRVYLVFTDDGRLRPCNVFTTVDPAISDRLRSDFTGIVTVGVIEPNVWVVLSARRIRGGAHVVLDEIVRELRTWKPAILGIETVAYQKALREFLTDRLFHEGIRIAITELQSTSGRGKIARISNLQPRFSTGTVWLKKGIGDALEYELLIWNPLNKGHDDLIDALSFHNDIAFPPSHGQAFVSGTDWFDLPPDERERIRRRKDLMDSGFGELRTGYTDGPLGARPYIGRKPEGGKVDADGTAWPRP